MQYPVSLGDELHVAILNPIVNHFHKMSGATRSDVSNARTIGNFRSYRFPNWTNLFVRVGVAARHQTGTKQRAFFAARGARADHEHAVSLKFFFTALGIFEIGVAAIDDDVALLQ